MDCEAKGYSHTISPADQVGYTRGEDYYRIDCECGRICRGDTCEAALAKLNAHAAEKQWDYCGKISEESEGHYHIAPSGTFICTKCRKEVAHSTIYAPHCNIIGCYD